eukprot:m.232883 g.232883  ORF g.232883 m.232883 type:complete len:452 (-) comp15239_c0_seq1:1417-2772(-)
MAAPITPTAPTAHAVVTAETTDMLSAMPLSSDPSLAGQDDPDADGVEGMTVEAEDDTSAPPYSLQPVTYPSLTETGNGSPVPPSKAKEYDDYQQPSEPEVAAATIVVNDVVGVAQRVVQLKERFELCLGSEKPKVIPGAGELMLVLKPAIPSVQVPIQVDVLIGSGSFDALAAPLLRDAFPFTTMHLDESGDTANAIPIQITHSNEIGMLLDRYATFLARQQGASHAQEQSPMHAMLLSVKLVAITNGCAQIEGIISRFESLIMRKQQAAQERAIALMQLQQDMQAVNDLFAKYRGVNVLEGLPDRLKPIKTALYSNLHDCTLEQLRGLSIRIHKRLLAQVAKIKAECRDFGTNKKKKKVLSQLQLRLVPEMHPTIIAGTGRYTHTLYECKNTNVILRPRATSPPTDRAHTVLVDCVLGPCCTSTPGLVANDHSRHFASVMWRFGKISTVF